MPSPLRPTTPITSPRDNPRLTRSSRTRVPNAIEIPSALIRFAMACPSLSSDPSLSFGTTAGRDVDRLCDHGLRSAFGSGARSGRPCSMSIMSSPYPEPIPLPRRPATVSSRSGEQPIVGSRVMDQRIGDAERSAVCEELSVHYAAGRLTDEELDVRVTAAVAARTWGELRPLVGDLPSAAPVRPTAEAVPNGAVTPWSALDVWPSWRWSARSPSPCSVPGGRPRRGAGVCGDRDPTATTAGVGGMALTQVLHRGHRSVVERATQRARGEEPAQRSLSGPA